MIRTEAALKSKRVGGAAPRRAVEFSTAVPARLGVGPLVRPARLLDRCVPRCTRSSRQRADLRRALLRRLGQPIAGARVVAGGEECLEQRLQIGAGQLRGCLHKVCFSLRRVRAVPSAAAGALVSGGAAAQGFSLVYATQNRSGGKIRATFPVEKMLFYSIFLANPKHMAIPHIKLPLVWP